MNSASSGASPHDETEIEIDETAERLHKLMSRAGLASRRAAEEMIREGRVSVNGHILREAGVSAVPGRDTILVDGKPLRLPTGPATVVMLHKPRGVMTTKNDPEGRQTVMDLLGRKYETLHPIGRLDFDTSGVLLLTDDGELTQLLTHPSHGVEKTYHARVRGTVKLETVRLLQNGVRLDDGLTAPCRVRVRAQTPNNALIEITLREGKNRQVRRMLEAVGHQVSTLRRVKFGPLELAGMPSGAFRILLAGEVHALKKAALTKTKSPRKTAPRTAAKPSVQTERAPTKSTPKTTAARPNVSRDSASRDSASRDSDGPTPFTGKLRKTQIAKQEREARYRSAKYAAQQSARAKNQTSTPQNGAENPSASTPKSAKSNAPTRATRGGAAKKSITKPNSERAKSSSPTPRATTSRAASKTALTKRIEKRWT